MSRGGTWPGNVAVEPLSNMDSAGSCDSVISMNSGFSDDSMEYLSPEERACLMFLEETIEALEVHEDSGLSNDELDSAPKGQLTVNDVSNLVPASGSGGKFLPLTHISSDPAPTLTTDSKTEDHALNQTSEPKSNPASAANMTDTETGEAQTSPPFPDSHAAAASVIVPTDVSDLTLNEDHDPEMVTSPGESSEIDLSIIPPPSDFMDEVDSGLQPEKTKSIPPPAEFLTRPEVDDEYDQLQSTDSIKTMSLSACVTEDPPSSPPADPSSFELSEPKSPPVVAPKPKKLPANILMKTAAVGSGGSSRHAMSTSSDRILMDPQKVRMEALQKLGLLGSQEEPMGLARSSKLKSKTRQSWAGPSPLISTPTPLSPPMTPSYSHVSIPPPASTPLQCPLAVSTPGPPTLDPDILPAPAAFSDDINPLHSSNHLPAVEAVLDGAVCVPPLTPPLTPPALVKQLTPPKVMDMTANLECSGVGQNIYTASQKSPGADQSADEEQNPKQLRSSRPRPASLGSGKEFSHAKGEDLLAGHASGKQPDSHRPHAHGAPQHSRESAKLPRSQGISVLICPRAENEGDRRMALKKLGLLRD